MAAGNYCSYMINTEGVRVSRCVSPAGVNLEIYKTWLAICDQCSWRESVPFAKPCVMEIQSANIRFMDLTIHATRGPQSGIYVVCFYVNPDQEKLGVVGCGVYGWDGDIWVGVKRESKLFLKEWAATIDEEEVTDFCRLIDV